MKAHTLSAEQMKMFVDAVGGVYEPAAAGGTYTTSYLVDFTNLIGGLKDFPKMTNDPVVNFAVDCVVDHDNGEDLVYDEVMYRAEIEAFEDLA